MFVCQIFWKTSVMQEGGMLGSFPLCVAFAWQPASRGPALTGHAAATSGGLVWSFGGLDAKGKASDALRTFDGLRWRTVDTFGAFAPSARMYTSLTASGPDTLVLCGGWDPGPKGSGGAFHDDIWRLCTKTGRWSRSTCVASAPFSRHTAHAVTVEGAPRVLIHTFRCDDHVLLYDAVADTLRRQPTTGHAPAGLSMQSGAVLGSRVVLFGGSTRQRQMTSAVFVLDTETWEWQRHVPEGGPSPRASSVLVARQGEPDEALLFGGADIKEEYSSSQSLNPKSDLWRLRLDEGIQWSRLDTDKSPSPRVASTIVSHGDEYVLHGGWDPRIPETLQDTWTLRLPASA